MEAKISQEAKNMSNAAQVETLDDLDQSIQDALEQDKEESAPQEVEAPEVEKPKELAEDKPKEDGFQKRINKVTADKWEALKRAEAAEAKLAEVQQAKEANPQKPPTLEDFDYDDQAYQEALIDYKVENKAKSLEQKQQEALQEQSKAETLKRFTENSAKFAADKEDFNDVLARVPILQPSVLNELMSLDNGPEIAYFLGNHSDIADEVIRMHPVAAGIKIGEISRKLAEPKPIKTSSAPEPIEPISSGGAVESDISDEMSMDEWMAKYNP